MANFILTLQPKPDWVATPYPGNVSSYFKAQRMKFNTPVMISEDKGALAQHFWKAGHNVDQITSTARAHIIVSLTDLVWFGFDFRFLFYFQVFTSLFN